MKLKSLTFLLFGLFCFIACDDEGNGNMDDKTPVAILDCTEITYSGDIQPLVASTCAITDCHGAGSLDGDYTTYDLLRPSAIDGSMERVVLEDQTMPQEGSLTSEQLGKIKCWLDAGAPNN